MELPMNYTTWMNETKRGVLTPRSTELKSVDTAFETCKDTASAGQGSKITLATKLKLWMDAQARKGGNWKTSTRNATKDVMGLGTIERLMRDLQKDSALANAFQAYVAAPLPVYGPKPDPSKYTPGKWDRSADRDGHWYDFIRQEKGNSCVCATIVMAKRAVHNLAATQLSESEIRGVMALEETGNLNSGISSVSNAAQNHHKWDTQGTGAGPALRVMKANPHGIASSRSAGASSGQGLLDNLNLVTRKRPALVGWRWTGGGGHFTMCVGPTDDGAQLIIIDPWTGINYIDNSLTNYTQYQGGQGTLGDVILTH
jgi:Papain-like cysteine protease AvrRpt2